MNSNNDAPLLTRAQCSVLRGIAIIGIFLHNFCHWLPKIVKENEYQLDLDRSRQLWHYLHHVDSLLPVQLLSFFGHYGVPLFVFLSGFGLVLKYERSDISVKPLNFITYNYVKLFRMLAVGIIVYYALWSESVGTTLVAAHLLMVVNLWSYGSWIINPGPFWFFGFMLQLYILYRFVLYVPSSSRSSRRGWLVPLAVIAVAWLSQAFLRPDGNLIGYMRLNVFAGLMPLSLGVLAARYAQRLNATPRRLWWAVLGVSVLAVWLSNYHFQAWLWSGAFVITGAVAAVKLMPEKGVAAKVFFVPLKWVGGCSAFIFMIHPSTRLLFFRYVPFEQAAMQTPSVYYASLAAYVAATLLAVWLLKLAMKYVPSPRLTNN